MLMAATSAASPTTPVLPLAAPSAATPVTTGVAVPGIATSAPSPLPGPLPGLGQTALSLMVVLGLIFALAWLLKRVQGVRIGGGASLRINAGLQVGPKEKVLIIEAAGRHLLIGVTAGSINTLHVFDQAPVAPPSDGDGKPTQAPVQPPMGAAFADALKRALGQESKS